jgi:hypothetical protein
VVAQDSGNASSHTPTWDIDPNKETVMKKRTEQAKVNPQEEAGKALPARLCLTIHIVYVLAAMAAQHQRSQAARRRREEIQPGGANGRTTSRVDS